MMVTQAPISVLLFAAIARHIVDYRDGYVIRGVILYCSPSPMIWVLFYTSDPETESDSEFVAAVWSSIAIPASSPSDPGRVLRVISACKISECSLTAKCMETLASPEAFATLCSRIEVRSEMTTTISVG